MYDAGVALALALVLAVVFASLFGLAVREVLIRPLGEGRLFAALVVTMGVAIGTEHFVGRHWGEQPKAFPRLVDGNVSIGGLAGRHPGPVDHRRRRRSPWPGSLCLFRRTSLGSAMRAVAESSETAAVLGINSQKVARIAWALGVGLATLGVVLYAPNVGLTPGGARAGPVPRVRRDPARRADQHDRRGRRRPRDRRAGQPGRDVRRRPASGTRSCSPSPCSCSSSGHRACSAARPS